MARRGRRHTDPLSALDREVFSPSLARPVRLVRDTPTWTEARAVEDRRTYHPLEFFRPARTWSGGDAPPVTPKLTPRNKPRPFLAHGLKFSAPADVLVCVRRQQRKEVLHALRKTGRGKGGGRKRRNWWSRIGC